MSSLVVERYFCLSGRSCSGPARHVPAVTTPPFRCSPQCCYYSSHILFALSCVTDRHRSARSIIARISFESPKMISQGLCASCSSHSGVGRFGDLKQARASCFSDFWPIDRVNLIRHST